VRDRPVLHGSEPDSPMVCAHSTGSRARRQALADSRRSEQDRILHAPSPPHTDILHDRRSGAVSAPAVLLHDRPPRYLLGDPAHHVGCVIADTVEQGGGAASVGRDQPFGGGFGRKVGYGDASYFVRSFWRADGATPLSWRHAGRPYAGGSHRIVSLRCEILHFTCGSDLTSSPIIDNDLAHYLEMVS
jgi:hypothetical protein